MILPKNQYLGGEELVILNYIIPISGQKVQIFAIFFYERKKSVKSTNFFRNSAKLKKARHCRAFLYALSVGAIRPKP